MSKPKPLKRQFKHAVRLAFLLGWSAREINFVRPDNKTESEAFALSPASRYVHLKNAPKSKPARSNARLLKRYKSALEAIATGECGMPSHIYAKATLEGK